MASKRLHLTLFPAQYKELQRLAEKLGMDVTNAIRYCIAVALAAERKAEDAGPKDK